MIASINPATGKIIKKFKETPKKDVEQAIFRARAAQQKWSALPKLERIKIIHGLKDTIDNFRKQIEKTVRLEIGYSPTTEGEFIDIKHGIDYYCARYAQLKTVDVPVDSQMQPHTSAHVEFVPH